jgi:hypothetical protein
MTPQLIMHEVINQVATLADIEGMPLGLRNCQQDGYHSLQFGVDCKSKHTRQ